MISSSLLAGGAGVWFTGLQLLAIRRLCPYCTVVHAAALLTAALALIWNTHNNGTCGPSFISVLTASAGLSALIVGQLLLEPKLYSLRITRPTELGTQNPSRDIVPGASCPATPPRVRPAGRHIILLDDRVQLDTGEWPMLGSPKVPHILVYLFDYTCPTCRKTHGLLLKAATEFGPRLSILMAPAPVDPSCNPYIQKQTAMHAQACRYARLGLLVWSLDPAKYEQFDHWIFQEEELPPLGIAVRRAKELLGTNDLDPAMPDPDLDRFIAQGVAMYKAAGSAKMPILLFPHAILTGLVPSAERLRTIFEEQFNGRVWVNAV